MHLLYSMDDRSGQYYSWLDHLKEKKIQNLFTGFCLREKRSKGEIRFLLDFRYFKHTVFDLNKYMAAGIIYGISED